MHPLEYNQFQDVLAKYMKQRKLRKVTTAATHIDFEKTYADEKEKIEDTLKDQLLDRFKSFKNDKK